eukprot:2507027-Prymnesium_polylepis.1
MISCASARSASGSDRTFHAKSGDRQQRSPPLSGVRSRRFLPNPGGPRSVAVPGTNSTYKICVSSLLTRSVDRRLVSRNSYVRSFYTWLVGSYRIAKNPPNREKPSRERPPVPRPAGERFTDPRSRGGRTTERTKSG